MSGEVDLDLRKFITALSQGQLSTGREARAGFVDGRQLELSRGRSEPIDIVKRLTPGVGIESLTLLGSDQKAAEALQEAETEVGVGNG